MASTPKKSSNLPYVLLGAGAAGMGGYWYIEHQSKHAEVKQDKSPLDPGNFKDFKLKRVIPYNDNTSKFVSHVLACALVLTQYTDLY